MKHLLCLGNTVVDMKVFAFIGAIKWETISKEKRKKIHCTGQ